MSDRVLRGGFEVSRTTADFLDEFGLTDEQVAAMDRLMDRQRSMEPCRICGRPMAAVDAADFDGVCSRCWDESDNDEGQILD